jgi:SAM-dependent methyltransferase
LTISKTIFFEISEFTAGLVVNSSSDPKAIMKRELEVFQTDDDLRRLFDRPEPFEMDLPWGDYGFSCRFYGIVRNWGVPTDREARFISRYARSKEARILDLAAGGGRHSLALAEAGFLPTAIEIGRFPAELARKKAAERKLRAEFLVGDIRRLDYGDEFDVAFLLCGQLGHFPPEDARLIFSGVTRALKKSGIFIVHLLAFRPEEKTSYVHWYREKKPFYFENPAVVHREQYYFEKERIKVIRDFAIDTITRKNRLFGISEKNYSRPEIEALGGQAGLTLREAFGDFDRTPLTERSDHNIYVFDKK